MMRMIGTAVLLFALVGQTGARAAEIDPLDGPSSLEAADQGPAPDAAKAGDDRLLIVNGHSGRVVYDDGHDDLFCVTRRVTVGYAYDGTPIHRRRMHCR